MCPDNESKLCVYASKLGAHRATRKEFIDRRGRSWRASEEEMEALRSAKAAAEAAAGDGAAPQWPLHPLPLS